MKIIKTLSIILVETFFLLIAIFGPVADMRNAKSDFLYFAGTILLILSLTIYAVLLRLNIKIIIKEIKS